MLPETVLVQQVAWDLCLVFPLVFCIYLWHKLWVAMLKNILGWYPEYSEDKFWTLMIGLIVLSILVVIIHHVLWHHMPPIETPKEG